MLAYVTHFLPHPPTPTHTHLRASLAARGTSMPDSDTAPSDRRAHGDRSDRTTTAASPREAKCGCAARMGGGRSLAATLAA
jgi:hypothetical protein